jgi:5-methylcytosine-specific restriction protein B
MTISTQQALTTLAQNKNLLLYGPPGTGKTWLLSNIINLLNSRHEAAGGRPVLNVGNRDEIFGAAGDGNLDLPLPENMTFDWVTFHQSYSYEEFIIGKFPLPKEGGVVLQPFFGLLMNAAINLSEAGPDAGHIIIIDELNRANASQVFGEFITLLDSDYRATINGVENKHALSIKLPGIRYKDGVSEPIGRFDNDDFYQLPEDWKFPENLYILATMNSVDRAALPLDSALTRRFFQLKMAPDLAHLAARLDVDLEVLGAKANILRAPDVEDTEALTAAECSVLLLDRLNIIIASELGKDFELGHALFMDVERASVENKWAALVSVWDSKIFPQLAERFLQDSDTMRNVLKASSPDVVGEFIFERGQIGQEPKPNASIEVRDFSTGSVEAATKVLRYLAL